MPTVIKIGTEKVEYQVLEGGRRILGTKPVLLVEVHGAMDQFWLDRRELWVLGGSLVKTDPDPSRWANPALAAIFSKQARGTFKTTAVARFKQAWVR